MTLHKKIFYWFISLVVLVGLVYAGSILFVKNYKPATKVAQQQGLTTPTGMVRDTSGTIPSVFKGFVDINDVKVVQESFIYKDQNTGKTQITFKYISDKDLSTNQKEMLQYGSVNKYKFLGMYNITDGIIIELLNKEDRKISINLVYTKEKDLQVTISAIY